MIFFISCFEIDERVCELIISKLGLSPKSNAISAELGANKLDTPLILVIGDNKNHNIIGIQEAVTGLGKK